MCSIGFSILAIPCLIAVTTSAATTPTIAGGWFLAVERTVLYMPGKRYLAHNNLPYEPKHIVCACICTQLERNRMECKATQRNVTTA